MNATEIALWQYLDRIKLLFILAANRNEANELMFVSNATAEAALRGEDAVHINYWRLECVFTLKAIHRCYWISCWQTFYFA